ncbi:MAG: zinc ribbon domain-containing protein [Dehalococcoidia bacterium]|nr:zinc ribbon domain-containing protein [Dehalococcoidia bacterium]
MPIYEYRCGACGRVSSVFFRSIGAVTAPSACPHCSAAGMERIISRVVHLKGKQRLAEMDTGRMLAGSGGPDKGRQARWARKVAEELGGEVGAEYREMAEKVENGDEAFELYDPSVHLQYTIDKAAGNVPTELAAGDPWAQYTPPGP